MLYRLRHIPTGLYVVSSANPHHPLTYLTLEAAEHDQAKIVHEYIAYPTGIVFTYEEFEIDEITDETP